jgi:hypothetical protein
MSKHKKKLYTDEAINLKLPPCAEYLGSYSPLIANGKLIIPNLNRSYYFISTTKEKSSLQEYSAEDFSTYPTFINSNLQISLTTFIIGLVINKIQSSSINYTANMCFHENNTINKFIHRILNSNTIVNASFVPSLLYTISNSNAIRPLYVSDVAISPLNYYILFIINRLENDPNLLMANNSFVTIDPLNLGLADIKIIYPYKNSDD